MELNSTSIHDVIHPTAAFSRGPTQQAHPPAAAVADPWHASQLNPKNRIDSLGPLPDPLWRIDGCTGLGTQYYALPLFMGDIPPMRFDVFIPEEVARDPVLRQLLDLNAAFHTKDSIRVRRLGITKHVLRTLQAWTLDGGDGGPAAVSSMYTGLPFGSRLVFENLHVDVRKIKITVAPTYYIEKQLLGLPTLADSLGLPPDILPESVDISQLCIVQQLHDSVCLVRLLSSNGEQRKGKLWILKALTSGTKYLYNELRNLLQLEPHVHVISRPRYLVTKYCRFGGKTGVVGFIIPYHSAGSLRDTLPLLRIHGRLTLAMQAKWAAQIASGLLHVREHGHLFYPDLRLDNIVVSDEDDAIMVDFEQRGVWCEFSAPEVNALEYTRILASSDTSAQDDTGPAIPHEIQEHYAAVLSRLLPDWETLQAGEEHIAQSPHGYNSYNVPWLCLSSTEQEAAEVYMLGRLLWCIFEGQSAPQHAAVWQSYRWEPEFEFPEFRRTPPALRGMIDRCTRGRRDILSNLVTRRGSKLVLRGKPPGKEQDAAEVLKVAREWWAAEVKAADDFLRMRDSLKAGGAWSGNYFDRPTLREVVAFLERFQATVGSAA